MTNKISCRPSLDFELTGISGRCANCYILLLRFQSITESFLLTTTLLLHYAMHYFSIIFEAITITVTFFH